MALFQLVDLSSGRTRFSESIVLSLGNAIRSPANFLP
jgi:hypothetical protein